MDDILLGKYKDMITQALFCYAIQILLTLGVVFVFGFLISVCNKQVYKKIGSLGRYVNFATGAIGTPIHELAHAIFCIIFGHKIIEIKFFKTDVSDGTLGYVKHSYDKKNLYHRIGNFFIGIAPIILISGLLCIFANILLPEMMNSLENEAEKLNVFSGIKEIFDHFKNIVDIFLCYSENINFYIYVALGTSFALHMSLSRADINGMKDGILFVLLIVLLFDCSCAFVYPKALIGLTKFTLTASTYIFLVMLLALVVSISAVILVSTVKRRLNRNGISI